MKKILLCALALLLLASCQQENPLGDYSYHLEINPDTGKLYCPDADYVICLEKNPDKDFVILNLADIQEENPKSTNVKQIIDQLVSTTKPDLITLTGDQSYGSATTIRQLGEILESYGIPWAPILGNHDHNERETSVEDQCKLYESFEHCLFKTGPDLGTTHNSKPSGNRVPRGGNYVINVTEGEKVVKTLVFLDSGDNASYLSKDRQYENSYNWDHLTAQQVQFFNQAVSSANSQDAILFTHIPIFEYVNAISAALKTNIDVYNVNTYIAYTKKISYEDSCKPEIWNDDYKDSYGTLHEAISCSPCDDNVFEAIRDNTDIIIVGHDHINSFIVDYKGVTFCYAMKTGPGCYYEADLNGGTVVTISSDGKSTVKHQRVSN